MTPQPQAQLSGAPWCSTLSDGTLADDIIFHLSHSAHRYTQTQTPSPVCIIGVDCPDALRLRPDDNIINTPRQIRKGLHDCNSPMCTLSQNGYGVVELTKGGNRGANMATSSEDQLASTSDDPATNLTGSFKHPSAALTLCFSASSVGGPSGSGYGEQRRCSYIWLHARPGDAAAEAPWPNG